jgi:hypothetical protein
LGIALRPSGDQPILPTTSTSMKLCCIHFFVCCLLLHPSSLHAQKERYYFTLNDLLSLTVDKDENVKAKAIAKGYEFWNTISTDTADYYSEATSRLRTGSNLTKYKLPFDRTFKVITYEVALQYPDQIDWLRALNNDLKLAKFTESSLNDSTSLRLNKDSTIQVFLSVRQNTALTQIATVSVYRLLNEVNAIRQFSVQEMEDLYLKLSYFDHYKYMHANSFLEVMGREDSYFQKTPNGEILMVAWEMLEYTYDRLRISFSTIQTYKKYLERFVAAGYTRTGNADEYKKGKITLSVSEKNLNLIIEQ